MTTCELKERSRSVLDKVLEYFSYEALADSNVINNAVRIKAYDEIIYAICTALEKANATEDNPVRDVVEEIQGLQEEIVCEFIEQINDNNKIDISKDE